MLLCATNPPTACLWLMRDPIALLFLTVQQLLVRLYLQQCRETGRSPRPNGSRDQQFVVVLSAFPPSALAIVRVSGGVTV